MPLPVLHHSERTRQPAGQGWRIHWAAASDDEVDNLLSEAPQPPGTFTVYAAAVASNMGKPCTYKQAIASSESSCWKEAMQAEFDGLIGQGAWELVDLPPGNKAIKSKWVYKCKLNKNSGID